MSEDLEDRGGDGEEGGKRKKKGDKPTDRALSKVDAVVKEEKFTEWLESLFYQDPEIAQFPERIEVNPVDGRNHERLGKPILQRIWTENDPKPPRPKIVELANEILFRTQRDCDIQRRETVYGVHIWHFRRGEQPYERWLIRRKATAVYFLDGEPREEEPEVQTSQERFAERILAHHETMHNLQTSTIEGLLDRMDRIIQRQDVRIEKQDAEINKKSEMLERALSLEAEREDRRAWNALKIKGVDRTLDMGLALAPPLLNQLVGKQLIPTKETPETISIKKFFLKKEEGGVLTPEQQDAAFGVYDKNPPHNLTKRGVLSPEQAQLLYDVAHCNVSPDELDKLLPDGPLSVTGDQISQLQAIGFRLEQLAPLHLIFEARMARKVAAGGRYR